MEKNITKTVNNYRLINKKKTNTNTHIFKLVLFIIIKIKMLEKLNQT
jgi:hypothetical protein